jgi:uncharacterized repeat protein (TIGR03803 family)
MRNLVQRAGKVARLSFAALCLLGSALAQVETVMYPFAGSPDGAIPYDSLISDSSGNFYGTTVAGGTGKCSAGCGTVFKMTSSGKETVIYSFTGGTTDGAAPYASLVRDKSGNLYGTTSTGGTNMTGTVFKISPSDAESILYNFGSPLSKDGTDPRGTLAIDAQGNLYGTTMTGGTHFVGTVFKVTPSGVETVLYNFSGPDGETPIGGPILDKSGNLYGTTYLGGAHNLGVVYALSPSGIETLLYSFNVIPDAELPECGLVFDKAGNLYGTTQQGGTHGDGTVFKVVPSSKTETVLYSFGSKIADGVLPYAGVIFDPKGNLYGTTTGGGADVAGIVFRLTPAGVESILHNFGAPNTTDGGMPFGGVIIANGALYGTTSGGGVHALGTVFKIAP